MEAKMSSLTSNERSSIENARRWLDAAEVEMKIGGGCRAAAIPMLYDALAQVGATIAACAAALERHRIEDAMARRAAEEDER
jgi:hypothetical protein